MKVLMLGWEFPPHLSGGLGTACQGLTRGLAAGDVDVTFVLPRLAEGHVEAGGDAHIVDCQVADEPKKHIVIEASLLPYLTAEQYAKLAQERGMSGADHGADLLTEVERYAKAVQKRVAVDKKVQEPFDVVHGHDWMTYPAATALAERLGVPCVLHVHSTEQDRAGAAANPDIVAIERAGLLAADRVVCVSRYTEQQVRTQYEVPAEKLRVVHNAVTLPDARAVPRPPLRFDEPVVLFLGRVTQQKGPELFLEAAARVVAKLPKVKFVMAGDGDLLPRMIERAAELGLARHVHFTGFLRGEDVDRMFDEASLFVLPSVSEPFGIAPLEALARDVPAIVSRQSGVSEVLSNLLTVDFWNTEELADKILEVLSSPKLARTLAERGRAELEALTWERQAGLVRDVYEEVA